MAFIWPLQIAALLYKSPTQKSPLLRPLLIGRFDASHFPHHIFKRSLSEQRFKKWLFIIILAKRVIFLNILLMHLHEAQWGSMSLNESEWVWMSLRACQTLVRIEKFCYMIEIGDTAVNIVRNCIPMRNCMLRERLWSESHFRLVFSKVGFHKKAGKMAVFCLHGV